MRADELLGYAEVVLVLLADGIRQGRPAADIVKDLAAAALARPILSEDLHQAHLATRDAVAAPGKACPVVPSVDCLKALLLDAYAHLAHAVAHHLVRGTDELLEQHVRAGHVLLHAAIQELRRLEGNQEDRS